MAKKTQTIIGARFYQHEETRNGIYKASLELRPLVRVDLAKRIGEWTIHGRDTANLQKTVDELRDAGLPCTSYYDTAGFYDDKIDLEWQANVRDQSSAIKEDGKWYAPHLDRFTPTKYNLALINKLYRYAEEHGQWFYATPRTILDALGGKHVWVTTMNTYSAWRPLTIEEEEAKFQRWTLDGAYDPDPEPQEETTEATV
jgi:hypothetical protein